MARPRSLDSLMARQSINTDERFSGEVKAVVYKPHEGFANYSLTTLTIKDNKVTQIEHSQPMAMFEILIKMDRENEKLLERLRKNYPRGYKFI